MALAEQTDHPTRPYAATEDDVCRLMDMAGALNEDHFDPEVLGHLDATDQADLEDADLLFGSLQAKMLQAEMAQAAVECMDDPQSFYNFWQENRERIRDAAQMNPEISETLVLCFKMGIAAGDGASMNCLGAIYYLGEVVEQDYHKAAELYEMAMDAGCYQSIINLGYIYEYGRIGAPDYQKAYEYYSLSAALAPSSEAVYKLGDMYSRGKAVARDMKKAYALYERSLQLAQNEVEYAQPAIRIAKLLVDPQDLGPDFEPQPLRALALFQQAEVGLRIDIADGQFYYRKRLQEAIQGQQAARELLEEDEEFQFFA